MLAFNVCIEGTIPDYQVAVAPTTEISQEELQMTEYFQAQRQAYDKVCLSTHPTGSGPDKEDIGMPNNTTWGQSESGGPVQ